MLRLLLDNHADVNKRSDWDDATPLFAACGFRNLKAVRLFLHNGADPNKARRDGYTPLHAACSYLEQDISDLTAEGLVRNITRHRWT
jgi:ankyrin repeat protein